MRFAPVIIERHKHSKASVEEAMVKARVAGASTRGNRKRSQDPLRWGCGGDGRAPPIARLLSLGQRNNYYVI